MQDNQDEPSEGPFDHLTEPYSGSYLLQSIWTQPRRIIQYLAEYDPAKYVIPLLILNGVVSMFQQATNSHWGDTMELTTIILLCVLCGPMIGIMSGYIVSGLLSFSGNWINGKATPDQIRMVLAWSAVPITFLLVVLPIELAVFGVEPFSKQHPTMDANPLLAGLLALIMFVLSIWSLVIFVIGLSEVQGFSVWHAILNCLLSGLVLIPFLIIILVLSAL